MADPWHEVGRVIDRMWGHGLTCGAAVQKGTQLTAARQLEASITGGQKGEAGASGASAPNTWSPDMLPHQAQLVELLQFLLERTQRKLRVAVMVSAWDLVESLGRSPDAFISQELPLLQQFLEANDDLLEHAVFGVSAQGGDITDASEKLSLLELDDALKRIKVRKDQVTGQDITEPIAWLLGGG